MFLLLCTSDFWIEGTYHINQFTTVEITEISNFGAEAIWLLQFQSYTYYRKRKMPKLRPFQFPWEIQVIIYLWNRVSLMVLNWKLNLTGQTLNSLNTQVFPPKPNKFRLLHKPLILNIKIQKNWNYYASESRFVYQNKHPPNIWKLQIYVCMNILIDMIHPKPEFPWLELHHLRALSFFFELPIFF